VTGTAAATVTVQSAPVLSLDKADGPDPVPSLGTLVYTLTFTNTGDAVATNVWLTDTLPTGVNFASADPTPAYQSVPVVAWHWPALSPLDGSRTVVLTVTVNLLPDGTVLTNQARLQSDQTLPVTADTATTTVQTADLVVGKWRVEPDVIGPDRTGHLHPAGDQHRLAGRDRNPYHRHPPRRLHRRLLRSDGRRLGLRHRMDGEPGAGRGRRHHPGRPGSGDALGPGHPDGGQHRHRHDRRAGV
jgi:uncharacterized repeat protein (TIGR01451 family)